MRSVNGSSARSASRPKTAEQVHRALVARGAGWGPRSSAVLSPTSSATSSPKGPRASSRPATAAAALNSTVSIPAAGKKEKDKSVIQHTSPTDGRLDLSNRELKTLDLLGAHQMRLETLVARSNLLRSFQGLGYMPNLKIIDLSSNCLESLEFFGVLPSLKELILASNSLTTLEDLPTIPTLEVLSVSSNQIESLRFMQPQPELRALFLAHNHLASYDGLPAFPHIDSVRTTGNPIERHEQHVLTTLIAFGPSLRKLNGQLLAEEDQVLAASFSPMLSIAIRYGAMAGDGEAQVFLLEMQKHESKGTAMPLFSASIEGFGQEGSELCANFSFIWNGERLPNATEGYDEATGLYFDFQWLRGDRAGHFVEIPNAAGRVYRPVAEDVGHALRVECTPVISVEHEDYGPMIFALTNTIVASEPIAVSAEIVGECVEGSTVSAVTRYCGGVEGESQFTWFRCPIDASPELITGVTGRRYTLRAEDVDCTLRVEFTPVRSDGSVGESILGKSAPIRAAGPSVANVLVDAEGGAFIERALLRGYGSYFGGREGASRFQWYRTQRGSTQIFTPIASATMAHYTATAEDVDRLIKFEYQPVNALGEEGLASSAITPPIAPCPPSITNLRIEPDPEGPFLEAFTLTAQAHYFGGLEGRSQITWYRRHMDDVDDDWQLMPEVRGKTYVPNFVDISHLFRVDYLPARADGKLGRPLRAVTATAIQACEPCMVFIDVSGKFVEGDELRAAATYLGGTEGESSCGWYRSMDADHEVFELIDGTENTLVYTPSYADVGRRLKFKIKPVRDDGVEGHSAVFATPIIGMAEPKFIQGNVVGELREGETLSCEGLYFGGEEGPTEVKWFRMAGAKRVALLAKGAWTYTLSSDDIGFEILVEVRPTRCDGVKGDRTTVRMHGAVEPAEPSFAAISILGDLREGAVLQVAGDYQGGIEGASEITWARVHPEVNTIATTTGTGASYTITADDLESRLRVTYLPVREDGVAGAAATAITAVVKPAPPRVTALAFAGAALASGGASAAVEGLSISVIGEYSGGAPGAHRFAWYQLNAAGERGKRVGTGQSYTPNVGDVGRRLLCEWVPVRSDGDAGEPESLTTPEPVAPGPPVVADVSIAIEEPTETLSVRVGEGRYSGGVEGSSRYQWKRIFTAANGTAQTMLIPNAVGKAYQPTPDDYGCALVFTYIPVRTDGVAGAAVDSPPSSSISFGPPRVLSFAIEGVPQEGQVLHGVFTASENTRIDRSTFQWLSGGVALPQGNTASYVPTKADIGRVLACEFTPADAQGVEGQVAQASVGPIQAGMPTLSNLTIFAGGEGMVHSSQFQLKGTYFGGERGQCIVTWMRAYKDQPAVWTEISTGAATLYQGNADDVDASLRAVFVPVRIDGVRGEPREAIVGPLIVAPRARERITNNATLGEVSWDVKWRASPAGAADDVRNAKLVASKKQVKIIELVPNKNPSKPPAEKAREKAPYSAQLNVYLDREDESLFTVVLKDGQQFSLQAASGDQRDEIALTIRLFKGMIDGSAKRRGYCH